MDRAQLEHILRAAGSATGHRDFVLIGSAAIFVWHLTVPRVLALSREADLFADTSDPDLAERIADELDGVLGQASMFDAENGYYCDGVGPETAVLPTDWRARAMVFSTPAMNGVRALTPDPNDIALSKLVAGRAKDMDWLVAAVEDAVVDLDVVRSRLDLMPFERVPGGRLILESRLDRIERRSRD